MKTFFTRALSSCASMLFALTLAAQAPVAIDTAANWQQNLPNLLGGNCVQISNVTYNGNYQSFAMYYDSTGAMGLTQGILISTGLAATAAGPNISSSTSGDGLAGGDADLDVYAAPYPTYDAVNVQFDFSSPIDDTIIVRYVFASEEYDEFTCTAYNDIFGFFVSGPGINGNQNIALIPGSTLPVAINSVNSGVPAGDSMLCAPPVGSLAYSQYYVNNDSGTVIEFDGYTTPMEAVFYAQAGQTYHLKIVVADVSDAIFDSGVFLEMQSIIDNINGTASYQGTPATAGIVELFGYNNQDTLAPLISTTNISATGDFSFNGIPSGAYILRTTLDTMIYPGTYPMYYDSVFLWDAATIVTLPCFNNNIAVNALQVPVNNGAAAISGSILINNVRQEERNPLDPAANINMFLVNNATQAVQAFTRTDANGAYQFNGIPQGSYRIFPDMPGLPVVTHHSVMVTANNSTYAGLDYIAENNGIFSYFNLGTDEATPAATLVRTFPNPAVGDELTLEFSAAQDLRNGNLLLTDISGREVVNVQLNGANQQTISISHLASGVYALRIIGATQTTTQKIVVNR